MYIHTGVLYGDPEVLYGDTEDADGDTEDSDGSAISLASGWKVVLIDIILNKFSMNSYRLPRF